MTAVAILLIITVIAGLQITLVKASNESASIQAANSSINQAFANVLDAEKAGGNVTQLLAKLNSAGEFLAEADNAYRSGNLANVTSEAENARLMADQVNSNALSLLNASIGGSQNSFVLTLIFSVDGVFVFVVVLLLVWRRFKRGYMKKLHGLKPEVVENAA
jgi:hypothetical protein